MAAKRRDPEAEFLRRVIEYEAAPLTTNFDRLVDAGVLLPDPDTLGEASLGQTLWRVIAALADIGVFLSQTDHLSDRELYAHLWRDVLREEVPLLEDDGGVWHVDLLSGGSEEDTRLFLRYYADEEWRRDWLEQCPGDDLPPHEDPPFDRDRYLPRPYDESSVH